MSLFKCKDSYEELEPITKSAQFKCRNVILFLVNFVFICVVIIILVLSNSFIPTNTYTTVVAVERVSQDNPISEYGLAASAGVDISHNILDLEQGKILGKIMESRAGRKYLAFLGIPYAKPPLGELRFQPPLPAEGWSGTLDATQFKPDCIQKDKYNPVFVTTGDEDCLYLNVFTTKNHSARFDQDPFPVMIYIHGGGHFGNATRYGAEYFMDENVVLVHFHYRLGVLGYLNLHTPEARGNQGLKDQVMAFKWVQRNIHKFGGNNQKVTIFGNSFGGQQASAHILSPMSKGLFHRAICQSGTEILPNIFTLDPMKSARELGEKLNCPGISQIDLLTCFKNANVDDLIFNTFLRDFWSSVEPPGLEPNANDVFFSDSPLNIMQSGRMNSEISLMIGGTSGEGLSFSLPILSSPNSTKSFNENWVTNAVTSFPLNNTGTLNDPSRIANAARKFYLGSKDLSREVEENFTAIFSDRRIFHPANVFAKMHLKNSKENVFLYYYNYQGDKSYVDKEIKAYGAQDEFLGSGHGDDVHMLFPYAAFPKIPINSKHAKFSRMMVRLFSSFADTGKPSLADNSAEWVGNQDKNPNKWFELSREPKMIDFLGARMKFWDSFNLTDLYV